MRTKKNNSPKENASVKKPSTKGTTETKKTVTTRDKRKYIDFKIKVKKDDPLPSFREDNIRLNN
ncbi:MAG: hypothetical protein FJZ67_05690 [Bacteroidetes bacterium]|nr:hypothetical protein [Bacteroidota bacterium]